MGKGMGGKGMETDRRLNSLADHSLAHHSLTELVLARFSGSGGKSPLPRITALTIAATPAVRYEDRRLDG